MKKVLNKTACVSLGLIIGMNSLYVVGNSVKAINEKSSVSVSEKIKGFWRKFAETVKKNKKIAITVTAVSAVSAVAIVGAVAAGLVYKNSKKSKTVIPKIIPEGDATSPTQELKNEVDEPPQVSTSIASKTSEEAQRIETDGKNADEALGAMEICSEQTEVSNSVESGNSGAVVDEESNEGEGYSDSSSGLSGKQNPKSIKRRGSFSGLSETQNPKSIEGSDSFPGLQNRNLLSNFCADINKDGSSEFELASCGDSEKTQISQVNDAAAQLCKLYLCDVGPNVILSKGGANEELSFIKLAPGTQPSKNEKFSAEELGKYTGDEVCAAAKKFKDEYEKGVK